MFLEKAIDEMRSVFQEIPYGIEHTMRVLNHAEHILNGETVSGSLWEITSLAAVLHDIGAVEANRKHGSMAGHFQELEGPSIAQSILERIGVPEDIVDRVCYIVGHHHTPESIDGVDFQILWEADTLEALLAEGEEDETILKEKVNQNFRTATGRQLALSRLGLQGNS